MVTLINSHVLFPHAPNWAERPKWSRAWETGLSGGVTGAESRQSLRAVPRVSLQWVITPVTLAEQQQLDDRVLAAKKSGLACAPYWGRASVLQAAGSTDELTLQPPVWTWAEDDYLFLLDESDLENPVYNLRQVTGVGAGGEQITLDSAVSQTFPAGSLVWPIFFGKFTGEDFKAAHGRRAGFQIKIAEMTSPQSQTVGDAIVVNPGIGTAIIGSTFVVA